MFQKVVFLFAILLFSGFSSAQSKRTISASPTVLDFGGVILGTTTTQFATLSNTGTMPIKISGVSSSSAVFAFAGVVPPVSLAAGESVQLAITFSPQVAGATTGSITVVSNAHNSPTVIAVTGSATAPLAPLSISTNSLPAATVGAAYSAAVSGTGGKSPYVWMVSAGVLPNGLTLASDSGMISGTAMTAGTATFTVTMTDAAGSALAKQLAITVNPAAATSASGKMWGAIQGSPYAFTMATPTGSAPFSWSVATGALPPGLSLDTARGTIQGTPTTDGTYAFTIQVRDIGTLLVTENFNLIVSSASTAYGNTGSAYATEGGGPDPLATILDACTGSTALLANKSYRLGRSVSAATAAGRCFTLNTGTRLDLAGFIVTGSIKLIGISANGVGVFNGTVNCTVVDSGNTPGCLSISSGTTVTAPARLHHLTITNTGDGTRAIHIDWPMTSKVGFASLQLYNITAYVPPQPAVSRSYAISLQGLNQTPEFFNNDLTCSAEASACQGIMCFQTGDCKMHHNRIQMLHNTTVGSSNGRAMLFDGYTQDGEAWNNVVTAYNNRGVRIRGSYNIRVHDNRFLNIEENGSGVIHLADPAATNTDDLNVLIDNNDFELAGGTVVFIRNGINAFVRNNRFSCVSSCSTSRLAYVRSPLTLGSTFSELTLENNPDVSLYLGAPQNRVDTGGVLNVCNSGQVSGLGVSNNVACSP
ncbi:MAG: putative Ig domain-containing protein [Terriglobales bacterium]